MAEGRSVAVLLPRPLDFPLDYLQPPGLGPALVPGDYVRAPLRGREEVGVVWGAASGETPPERLRPLRARVDLPPMDAGTRRFFERAAAYTITPLGAMLSLAFRTSWIQESGRSVRAVRRTGRTPARMTAPRRAALAAFEALGGGAAPVEEILRRAGVSESVVLGLVRCGALESTRLPVETGVAPKALAPMDLTLNPHQEQAAEVLTVAVRSRRFQTTLLRGVTGSGKTEVYLRAVVENYAAGRQSLVLLPEIALTDALVRRLVSRLGVSPTVWHSAVSAAARRRTWRAIARGEARIVVGARSALFLPFRALGLIVVDEEHDPSYKQEEGVVYGARDMAVLRGACESVPVVLASATPSIETWSNARRGRYAEVSLPIRVRSAVLPEVETLDLRAHRPEPRRWLAPPLVDAIRETLSNSRQALLFLNRRGYAPLLLCRSCNFRFGCPNCDAALVVHQRGGLLRCHHCGHAERSPARCPDCAADDSLVACGPGVERLAEEVDERFPEARQVVLSSDEISRGAALRDQLEAIAKGNADIVIGTQLVAKGHNFPKIQLVGIVDADLCLRGGDLRAGERTFQITRQVTGRAGRVGGKSRALLQTVAPDHPVMRSIVSGDEEAFLQRTAGEREAAGAPPFLMYVAAIVSGSESTEVENAARALSRAAGILKPAGIRLLGPAPAPIHRLRNRWRWRFLAIAPKSARSQSALREWLRATPIPKRTKVILDVDPQTFL